MRPKAFVARCIFWPWNDRDDGTKMKQQNKKRETEQKLTPEIDPIEAGLKRVYEETAKEPLPDKLVELLNQLRAKDRD